MAMSRILTAMAVAAAIAAFFWFDLGNYLTLDALKAQQAGFAARYAADPVPIIAGFMALYIAVTAASLPGAAILTLAAGALFGVVTGTIIVSFASSIGATLAFLVSRHLFRDFVAAKFGARLKAIDAGIARDGAFYLFSLRLVPAFPFFIVNLLMGLTAIRSWTFYWVSQLGMLLGTIVYVNAGTQLAQISSLGDIVSPGLLLSFTALGLLPWAGKAVMAALKRRRVYARFTRPRRFDRNLVVIGAGAAGLVSSYIAATVRAKVTLVENHKMGGDCLNFGCVPSKALIKSARVAKTMREAAHYGLTPADPKADFRAILRRVEAVITAIEPHDSVERFTGLGVDVEQGYATIVDPWTVEIRRHDGSSQRLTTRAIVIAAGAAPAIPPIPGLEDSGYVTSDTLWERFAALETMPERLVVLGGGPIGCELAQAFALLGARVTQVEMADRLLLREDEDVSAAALASQQAAGVDVRLGNKALRYEGVEGDRRLIVTGADGAEVALPFDALLVAVGRQARLTGYGLEALGIDTDRTVATDDYLATLYPNIYAAGDVAGPYQLTHVASHQAWFATVNALFGQFKRFKADYRVIPAVTFLDPEIARVGLTEREAAQQGIAVDVTTYGLDDLDRAIADGTTEGFVKLLTARGKDRIVGAAIVGAQAGELLTEYVMAMKFGLGANKLLATIHSYPTMAEANKYVAGQWKQARKPEKLLALVERYHGWRRG
jgi:pyruvate/2-oxoglutarate dehydrogenase complex dihydrolipoamide dehydrogenase (E3) component/uncharacterized membrane protein YdjX (TVP38/TMEM64 family)